MRHGEAPKTCGGTSYREDCLVHDDERFLLQTCGEFYMNGRSGQCELYEKNGMGRRGRQSDKLVTGSGDRADANARKWQR